MLIPFLLKKHSIWNVHFRCFPFILAPDCVGRSRTPPTGRNPTCPAPWPPLFGTQLNCLLFRVEIWPTKNYFFEIKFNSKNEPPLKRPNLQGILLTPNSAKVTLFWTSVIDSLQGVAADVGLVQCTTRYQSGNRGVRPKTRHHR